MAEDAALNATANHHRYQVYRQLLDANSFLAAVKEGNSAAAE